MQRLKSPVGMAKCWVRHGANYKALDWNCINADMQSIQAGEKVDHTNIELALS